MPPPKFSRHAVPLAMKAKVERELEKLQSMGIISPVQFSTWAAPIVPVLKQSGEVRICRDYKITINQACTTDSYPLPKVDDLLANLAGQYFSKLDLSQAYLQLPLDEQSKVCHRDYAQGLVQIQPLTLWGIVSAIDFSTYD